MKKIKAEILIIYDEELVQMISTKYAINEIEALKRFIYSKTYEMLEDVELEMIDYDCEEILELWEVEQITGDPRNSPLIQDLY